MKAILRFDGGAKVGNATAGAVLMSEEWRTISHIGERLGDATNNLAEHTAFAIGLEMALREGVTNLAAFGDSQLVIGQVTKGWGVSGLLMPPVLRSKAALTRFEKYTVSCIPRELNTAPDTLCHAVEEGWWLAPGASSSDGTAMLGFVISLELDSEIVREMPKRNAIKKSLQEAVTRSFPLVREPTIKRTNADPFFEGAKGLAIITYVVRLHVGEATASKSDKRAEVEMRVIDAAASVARGRIRVARVSG